MKRVIIESPYAGDVERNVKYARQCMLDCLKRGEAPFASHLLYTQVLSDSSEKERTQGMSAGFEWYKVVDASVVYVDLGISSGMIAGMEEAAANNVKIEFRRILGI